MIDYNAVRDTFEKIAGKELSYREGDNITTTDVLDDIFQTSLCISTRGMQGEGVPCYTDVKLSNFAI